MKARAPTIAPPRAKRIAPGTSASATAVQGRVDLVDAARGVAIAMMIAYHFCFDLTWFGWAHWPMLDDARWIAWRSAIVASFLFLAGVSLALRDARERASDDPARAQRAFLRRWAQIAGAALLVSAGSIALFPKSFIYFGVLHFVAVALWICRRAPRLGAWAIVLGFVVLAIGLGIHDALFDPRLLNWIGFAEHKPVTEDYVPLFPWLGVMLAGCGGGALWTRHACRIAAPLAGVPRVLASPPGRTLAFAGRWSLTIYLIHQPVLMAVLAAVRQLA